MRLWKSVHAKHKVVSMQSIKKCDSDFRKHLPCMKLHKTHCQHQFHQTVAMKNLLFILISILICTEDFGQSTNDEAKRAAAFYSATGNWFSAWRLVSKEIFQISNVRPVDFVLFDDKYVYSTSTTTIKKGKPVKGHDLLNLALKWKKELHNGKITLPDKTVIPVSLLSFAGEIPNQKGKSFFVMPLPSYWAKSGTESKELGLKKLVTGVFVHEFSHSQQMQNFGNRITQFEKQNNFGVDFSDNVVQDLFDKDSSYQKVYSEEVHSFYRAVKKGTLNRALAKEGLRLMALRHNRYFNGAYSSLKDIDNFFLTMEGLGQYSMFLWLTHPKGGNIDQGIAVDGIRRKKKWWSQDEGFALFLILHRLTTPSTWVKEMFGYRTESVVRLLVKKLP